MRSFSLPVSLFFIVGLGCAPDAPLVIDKHGQPMDYNTVIASGSVDGYYFDADLALFSPDLINAINLKLQVELAVPSKLLYGTWILGPHGGHVTAEWLDLFGGQGDSPVISGRFKLHHATNDSVITYVVNLPKTEIKPAGMGF